MKKMFLKSIGCGLARIFLVATLLLGAMGSASADVPGDLSQGLPLKQVLANALELGMNWDEAVMTLIQSGVDPKLVIQAAIGMEADAYTVVAAAIKSGANPQKVIDAALEAKTDPMIIRKAALANEVPQELIREELGGDVMPLEASMSSIPETVQEQGRMDSPSALSPGSALPPSNVKNLKGPGGEERPPNASPFK
jgi:hypothetical protein